MSDCPMSVHHPLMLSCGSCTYVNPGPALSEHDRLVAERAWDEGFTRGFYAGQSYPDGTDASEPDIDNPYRKEQENNNA